MMRNDPPSEECGKVSHRRETFKTHLQTSHGMSDQSIVEDKLESCRIGRNCEARFWCGFCETTIEVKQPGYSAWAERFDHIDDHYAGRNNQARKEISDWKNVDPEQPTRDSVVDDPGELDRDLAPSHNAGNKTGAERSRKSNKQRRKGVAEGDERSPKRKCIEYYATNCVSG